MPKTVDSSEDAIHFPDLVSCCQELYRLVKEQGRAISIKDMEMFNRLTQEIRLVQETIERRVGNNEFCRDSKNNIGQIKLVLGESYKENQQNIRQMQEFMVRLKHQMRNIGRLEKYLPQDKKRQGRIIDKNV